MPKERKGYRIEYEVHATPNKAFNREMCRAGHVFRAQGMTPLPLRSG